MKSGEKKCPRCAEAIKAEAAVCRYCGHEFSADDVKAAVKAAGRPASKTIGCVVTLLIFVLLFSCMTKLTGPNSDLVAHQLQETHDKVARDAVDQYNIAARSGTTMDRCVQAGLVAAAFLQAQDQSNYAQWKSTEQSDCAAAGVPR